jgi:hypothetical protein
LAACLGDRRFLADLTPITGREVRSVCAVCPAAGACLAFANVERDLDEQRRCGPPRVGITSRHE